MSVHLSRAHQQHRDIDRMTHLVGSRPIQNVANEAVPVCSHGDQVDIFLAGELDNFIRRLAQCQHLLALGKLELIEIACDPPISHVNEQQLCASHPCQRLDMSKYSRVGRTVLEWDQYVVVHDTTNPNAE